MWWSGDQEGYSGGGVLVKEELYDKVVEVRRVNARLMSLAIVYGQEVVRVVWAYAAQRGKSMEEKEIFYEDLSREWTTHHMIELIIGMENLNRHVGFQGVHGELRN